MGSITTNFIYLTLQGYFITWLFYTAVLQDYWLTKIYGKESHPAKKFFFLIQLGSNTISKSFTKLHSVLKSLSRSFSGDSFFESSSETELPVLF